MPTNSSGRNNLLCSQGQTCHVDISLSLHMCAEYIQEQVCVYTRFQQVVVRWLTGLAQTFLVVVAGPSPLPHPVATTRLVFKFHGMTCHTHHSRISRFLLSLIKSAESTKFNSLKKEDLYSMLHEV